MHAPSEAFRPHLSADESIQAVGRGTLLEDDYRRKRVSVGITDRRLIAIVDDGGFVDVGYESIYSIRSRARDSSAYRSDDPRLWVLCGGLVALAAFFAIAVSTSGALAPSFTLAFIGSVAFAEYDRRNDADLLEAGVNGLRDWLDDAVGVDFLRTHGDRVTISDETHHAVWIASIGLSLVFLTAVAFATNPLVIPLTCAVLGGLAVADYAHRHGDEFNDTDRNRHQKRDVAVHLVDGRTVRVRIDAEECIDRELSRLLHGHSGAVADPTASMLRPGSRSLEPSNGSRRDGSLTESSDG